MKKIIFAAALLACASCSEPKETELKVYVDEEFTSTYMPDKGGVTAADGTISFVLEDGTSLFMTGDCFLGDVINGQRPLDDKMINNSFVHLDAKGNYIGSIYNGTNKNPESLCVPLEAATSDKHYWYWPGHGFQEGNMIILFMTKFFQGEPGQWGFRFDGTDVVTMNAGDYSVESIKEAYDGECPIHWGHSIMKDNGYYYIYGTRTYNGWDNSELCVSRAKYDSAKEALGSFEYFNGKEWTADASLVGGHDGITIPVSEQFSVFRYKDTYVLLTSKRGQQVGDIYSFISDTPYGPWRNGKLLYVTQEQLHDKNLFTYNAMAHPQYINDKDELLICYNINSYDLQQIFRDVDTYRPVFLRVPMKMILK